MQQRTSNLLVRALLAVLWTYLLTFGATTAGLLDIRYRPVTALLLVPAAGLWLLARTRLRWSWYRTPLDAVIPLWAMAFAVSLAANPESARRIAIGLWYVGVYLVAWYILQDLIVNSAMSCHDLQDAILIAACVVVFWGLLQVYAWAAMWNDLASGVPGYMLPLSTLRPASTLDNPNKLAAFLCLIVPIAFGAGLATQRRAARMVLGLFGALSLVLLFLTGSRGGWLGGVAGLGLLLMLWMAHYDFLSPRRMVAWWLSLSRWIKGAIGTGILVASVALVALAILLVRSFGEAGRSPALRVSVYAVAVEMLSEKPVTGHGLFTFGQGAMRLVIPEYQQLHNHAHNVFLQIGAELGLIGLAALAFTLLAIGHAIRRNWQIASGTRRLMLAGWLSGLGGFAVHHLTDFAMIAPAVALPGLLVLALSVAPEPPLRQPVSSRSVPIVMGLAALIVTGAWSTIGYAQYTTGLERGIVAGDYAGAAGQIQRAIETDPGLPIYALNQGYFFGLLAHEGDLDMARAGAAAYERFLSHEPYFFAAWANLGALHWQLGEQADAITAMSRAAELVPYAWVYPFQVGVYREAMGDMDGARLAYMEALRRSPDASLYPVWRATPLRQALADEVEIRRPSAAAARLLRDSDPTAAATILEDAPAAERESVGGLALQAILALEQGNRAQADRLTSLVNRLPPSAERDRWLILLNAFQAWADDDSEELARLQTAIHQSLTRDPFDAQDDGTGAIAYTHYLRIGLPRLLLPQLDAPDAPPSYYALLDLLDRP